MTTTGGVDYGWRAFALDGGRLLPPFGQYFFSQHLDVDRDAWRPGLNTARCLVAEHAAPDPDCTCGLHVVRSLPRLLQHLADCTWPGADRRVAQLVGAIGRVKFGTAHPATYPVDRSQGDPDTTVRVARGWLCELWLSPGNCDMAEPLHQHLGVPVRVATAWPGDVDPEPKVRAALAALDLPGWAAQSRVWLKIAGDAAAGFQSGLTPADARSGLFYSGAGLSLAQCRGITDAVVEHLAPETANEPDQLIHGRPITVGDVMARGAGLTA